MKKLFFILAASLISSVSLMAEDHVMAATRSAQRSQDSVPALLSLSLKEAQDYAVKQNRTLRNASLAVQEAYAQRWQTIAAMLPSVDGSYSYSNYCGYTAEMTMMGNKININMPNVGALGVTAAIGINGQGIVGVLLNNVAIKMKKIALEKSENELRSSVMSAYVSVLALQSITGLLDSSLVNIQDLEQMTQNAVNVGAAEQTSADQIRVRVNTLKNNINAQKRNVELATNSLKVLLDVPVETELVLTENMDEVLSPERVLDLLSQNFAIENNLNYQLLQQQVELAKRNVHMAGWAYGPTVALAYNYQNQKYYGEGGMRMTPPNVVQVTVKMPLWSSNARQRWWRKRLHSRRRKTPSPRPPIISRFSTDSSVSISLTRTRHTSTRKIISRSPNASSTPLRRNSNGARRQTLSSPTPPMTSSMRNRPTYRRCSP